MRAVIAGGSGLIGGALTEQLARHGYEIIILSRNPVKVTGLPNGAHALFWDSKTIGDWIESLDGADAVINLVGENLSGKRFLPTRWTDERKARLINSRLDAGIVLTKAIELVGKKPAMFLQSSGISYYGTHLTETFTEESPVGNDFLADLSKEWESSTKSIEYFGVRRVVIRSAIVLSTKSGALPRITLPYKLFVGGRIGTGRQVYSWIHIDDEVAAICYLIENQAAEGVFNLSAPYPVTNDEFGKTIGKVLKRPHYFPLPGFIMRIAFGEVATVVLEGQKVLPKKLLQQGFKFKFPNLEDALQDIYLSNK